MKPGEPKKGGGGGMFTWGRADDTSNNYRPIIEDKNDPNYASESSFEVPSSNNSVFHSPVKPSHQQTSPLVVSSEFFQFDELELKKETRVKVDQVFSEGTYSSFISWIRSLDRSKLHSLIFSRTVQVALDKAESEYEVAWGLLELLYSAKLFSPREIRRGFDRIFRSIHDILTDVPNAAEVVLELLNKIVAEGVLSPYVVLRVPVSLYNLGRGAFVLRNIKSGPIVLSDLIETLPETKEMILQLLREYYATGVSDGVAEYLKANRWYGSIAVRKAIELALDRNNHAKELCSRLLAEISGYCTPESLVEGFDDILWKSGELAIDVPSISDLISKFIARAIVDDSLPANYVQEAEVVDNDSRQISILMDAYVLLKPKEAFTCLESVWGPQGGTLDDYKGQFKAIVQEFFDSKDFENVEACIRELSCKHYMHEFVKKLVDSVMDKGTQEVEDVIRLLNESVLKGFIYRDQVEVGLNRVKSNLSSLILDVPRADAIFEKIIQEVIIS